MLSVDGGIAWHPPPDTTRANSTIIHSEKIGGRESQSIGIWVAFEQGQIVDRIEESLCDGLMTAFFFSDPVDTFLLQIVGSSYPLTLVFIQHELLS